MLRNALGFSWPDSDPRSQPTPGHLVWPSCSSPYQPRLGSQPSEATWDNPASLPHQAAGPLEAEPEVPIWPEALTERPLFFSAYFLGVLFLGLCHQSTSSPGAKEKGLSAWPTFSQDYCSSLGEVFLKYKPGTNIYIDKYIDTHIEIKNKGFVTLASGPCWVKWKFSSILEWVQIG